MSIDRESATSKLNLAMRKYLLHAAKNQHQKQASLNELKDLIEQQGVDVNINLGGFTPLHMAIHANDLDLVNRLLEKGADLQKEWKHGDHTYTPLQLAAVRGARQTILNAIIEKGVNVNAKNQHGDTALHLIAYSYPKIKKEKIEIVNDNIQLLISVGADTNIENNEHHNVIQVAPADMREIIKEPVRETIKDPYSEDETRRKDLIDDLKRYIKRVETYRENSDAPINFKKGFIFFKDSRGKNREANYKTAIELQKELDEGHKSINEIFKDTHIAEIRKKFDHTLGIHSKTLKKIIHKAQKLFKKTHTMPKP